MKKLLLLLLLIPLVSAQLTYVNDHADILTPSQEQQISSILQEIHESGEAEFAIVTISSLEGRDIEGYAYEIAEGNLGTAEKDNGLLLLVAVEDRQYRFEVGRGLEPRIPDIIAGRIGRTYLEPKFKQGDYAGGLLDASGAVKAILVDGEEMSMPIRSIWPTVIIFLSIMLLMVFLASLSPKKKKPRKDKDYFTAAYILSQMMKGGSGGFSRGGSSGGFSGGGSFGGGGASGGW